MADNGRMILSPDALREPSEKEIQMNILITLQHIHKILLVAHEDAITKHNEKLKQETEDGSAFRPADERTGIVPA